MWYTIINKELYKPGMEDGWDCYDLMGKYLGFYSQEKGYPRSRRVPVINTPEGNKQVSEGDWILTDIDGKKHIDKGR